MKWPLVSRTKFDAIVANRDTLKLALDMAHASLSRHEYESRYLHGLLTETMQRHHELARPVTVAPTAPALVVDAEPKEVDPVSRTIREQAGRDTHLANHLRQYARELRSAGLNDDAIVGKLVAWQTSEPEDHAASA